MDDARVGPSALLTEAVRVAFRGLWFGVIPALLAIVSVRTLVPSTVDVGLTALEERLAAFGAEHPIEIGAAFFVLYALLVREWKALLPGGSYLAAADTGVTPLPSRQRAEGVSVALGIILAALLALMLKTSVFGTYRVLSGSMLPTFRPNDHVLVNKVSYGHGVASRTPRRGDVVVFAREEGDGFQDHVKRVIGVPGDEVKMDGLFPVINGWTVPSCNVGPYAYVSAGKHSSGRMRVEWLEDRAYLVLFGVDAPPFDREYVVPDGEVFVLGDNRSDSEDSRTYNSGYGGGAEVAAIEGRVDWFLFGTKNDGSVSLRRLMAPLGTDFSLEGVSVDLLEKRIRACLGKPPKETRPPSPSAANRSSASP